LYQNREVIALLAPAADAATAHRVYGTGAHAAAVTDTAHAAIADTTAAPADTALEVEIDAVAGTITMTEPGVV